MSELFGLSPDLAVIAVLVFVIAGFVKGLVGFGLPAIGLGLMTVFVGIEKAMLLILEHRNQAGEGSIDRDEADQ